MMPYYPLATVNVLLKDTIRDMLRPMVRDTVSGSPDIQRYFTTLSAAAGQYYQFSSPINLGADFEIELDFMATNTVVGTLIGGYQRGNNELTIDISPQGQLRFIAYNFNVLLSVNYSTVAGYNDGKLHKLNAVFNNGEMTLTVDGTQRGSWEWPLNGQQTLGYLGKRQGDVPQQLEGLLANFKVWTGGDRTTGTQIVDMPLDENWQSSAVARNRAGSITATAINITSADAERYTQSTEFNGWISNTELVTQAVWEVPNSVNPAWTYDAGDNTWNLDGDGTAQSLYMLSDGSQPEHSYFDSTVLSISVGSLTFVTTSPPVTTSSSGRYRMVIDKSVSGRQEYKREYARRTDSITAKLAKPSLRKFLPLGAA